MSSKQSCFKSIFKCDLKRSWWISALATLFIFMSSTGPIFNYSINRFEYGYSRYDGCVDFANEMVGNYFIGMFMAAFVVLYLFSYINKVNSVSFFHGLPATRTTLFFAHLTSSAVLIITPMLLNALVSFLAVGRGVKASWILAGLFVYIVYSFAILSLTLLVSMLTGVSIASGIFTGVLVALPVFIASFVLRLCNDYLYGFSNYDFLEETLVKYVYLLPESLLSVKSLIYIIGTIAFIAFSLFLYKKRHLENYGEVIAFPCLKGLFKVLFAICCGILGYYYFDSFWNVKSILTMLVFGSIGAIIAHMLANKSLSFKGALKPVLATCAVVVVLFVAFFFDMFGFEKRMPGLEDIEYAEIGDIYYDDYEYVDSDIYGIGHVRVTRKHPQQMHFDTDEEKQFFLDLHKYAIDHQNENDIWDDDIITPSYRIVNRGLFNIEYTLKNGKKMKRQYVLPEDELEVYTSRIYNTDTYRKWKYPVLDEKEVVYSSVQVSDSRTYYDEPVILAANREEAKRIIEAIKKDRRNITSEMMHINDYGSVTNITLVYTIPYVDENGREYRITKDDTYAIGKLDTNTLALLEELNLFADERMLALEDIVDVEVYLNSKNVVGYVNVYDSQSFPQTESSYAKPMFNKEYVHFSESEDIAVMYDIFMNHYNEPISKDENSYRFTVILYKQADGNSETGPKSREIIMRESQMPEILLSVK